MTSLSPICLKPLGDDLSISSLRRRGGGLEFLSGTNDLFQHVYIHRKVLEVNYLYHTESVLEIEWWERSLTLVLEFHLGLWICQDSWSNIWNSYYDVAKFLQMLGFLRKWTLQNLSSELTVSRPIRRNRWNTCASLQSFKTTKNNCGPGQG